jgi:hypothetical protein
MSARWAVDEEVVATVLVAPTAVTDATPVVSTALDLRTFSPGARHELVLEARADAAGNTGGTWVVKESATSGGSYTTATTDGSLAATGAVANPTNVQRTVAVLPNPAKPWLKITFTGADASAEATVSALLVTLPRSV